MSECVKIMFVQGKGEIQYQNAECKRLTEDVGPPFSSFALVYDLHVG